MEVAVPGLSLYTGVADVAGPAEVPGAAPAPSPQHPVVQGGAVQDSVGPAAHCMPELYWQFMVGLVLLKKFGSNRSSILLLLLFTLLLVSRPH